MFAVLDTDALAPWLGDLLPADTGLLNFFYLDSDSETCDPAAADLAGRFRIYAPQMGAVVAARSGHAVETDPPARSGVFAPVAWAASPGFAFPDTFDPAWWAIDVEPGADGDLVVDYVIEYTNMSNLDSDWPERPGALYGRDAAFGWPIFPTGSSPLLPGKDDPNRYHHLLQLSDEHEWRIGGDGGWMHWSIPTDALRTGDFSRAIPTPDIW
ncbi:DUF1963 domain-containing protein [Nonomuraea jiangxiensis]|nr:DUF1963 domain-containing protein [Nonomuraea jiangxiensis]